MAITLEWFGTTGYDVDIPALAREFGITPTTLKQWGEPDWRPDGTAPRRYKYRLQFAVNVSALGARGESAGPRT